MTIEQALFILKNTAWIGSNERRQLVEEAIKVVEEALKREGKE